MRRVIAGAVLALVGIAGCHSAAKPSDQGSAAAPGFKVYHLRGKVISTNTATGEVTVDHEAGTIVWPGGIDLAPEPLYEQAKAHPLLAA